MKKHLLVDGNNLLYRAYHTSNLTRKDGLRISGAFGATKMLTNLVQRFNPSNVIIAWDKGRSQPRLDMYPEYKQQRAKQRDPKDVEAVNKNIALAKAIFKNLPVKQICIDGVEADDILGYLSNRLTKGNKIIVSNDQDFLQLVQKGVYVFLPNKNKLIGPKSIESFLGFAPDKYVLWKSLVGDSSDNIKGIPKIGPKRATDLIVNNGVIKEEWLPIIDRNCNLMNIGLVLTEQNISEIHRQYIDEKNKVPSTDKLRATLSKNGFKSLIFNFRQITSTFSKLRK